MNRSITFTTELRRQGNNTGIEVPAGVIEELGAGSRPALVVDVDGFEFASTVGVMGGRFLIPFSAARRAATGLAGGDPITVTVQLDISPRTVEIPDDLGAALEAAGVRAAFDALAPSRRKAHVVAVESAKAEETRSRRVRAVVEGLASS